MSLRRRTLVFVALVTLLCACMQTLPGSEDKGSEKNGGDGSGCLIGGTSVGCGNPTKSVALNPIDLCGTNDNCSALPIWVPIDFQFQHDSIYFMLGKPQMGTLRPDTELYVSNAKVVMRYDGQIHGLDSLVLAEFDFSADLRIAISVTQICKSLDKPDMVCSAGKMNAIGFSLQVFAAVPIGAEELNCQGVYQGFQLDTRTMRLTFRDSPSMFQTGALRDPEFNATVDLDSSFPALHYPKAMRIFFVPGTEKQSILCGDERSLLLSKVIPGKIEIRELVLAGTGNSQWRSIYQVDSIQTDPFAPGLTRAISQKAIVDSIQVSDSVVELLFDQNCR